MASAEKYAEWIVANQAKKGTPEFETVAAAYKQAKATSQEFKEPEWLSTMRAEQSDPLKGMGAVEKFAAGYGAAVPTMAMGIGQRAQMVDQQSIDEMKRQNASLLDDPWGAAGNFAGNLLPQALTAALPGANTLRGAAAIGAGLGLIQPTATGESVAGNVGIGAAAGAGGNVLGRGIARALRPETAPAARELLDSGVSLTPGQILGGAAKRVEDGLVSVPILGDAIKAGQRDAVEQFNVSIGNRVLAPIGETVPPNMQAGHDMVRYVGDRLSDSYNALLPRMSAVADGTFRQELSTLTGMARNMADGGRQFNNIMRREVLGRMAPNGGMRGETLKEIQMRLGELGRSFSSSADGNQRILGNAIQEVQRSLRGLVQRSNPADADTLRSIDEGWAMLVRLENAAGRAGSREGVFSPSALRGATKAADSSARDRATARGTALLQREAEGAESVLGPTVPDSGTPFRLMAALGGTYMLNPAAAAAGAAGATAYGTRAGRNVLAAILARRPQGAQAAADAVRRYAVPVLPAGGAALAAALQARPAK